MEPILHTELLCRACVSPLREERFNLIETPTLFELYIRLSTTNISPSDSLPKSICSTCYRLLNDFQGFQQMCVESYNMLFDRIKTSVPKWENYEGVAIKIENSSEVPESLYSIEYINEFSEIKVENNDSYPLVTQQDQESFDSLKKHIDPLPDDGLKVEVFTEQEEEIVVETKSSKSLEEGNSIRRTHPENIIGNRDVLGDGTQMVVKQSESSENSRPNLFVCGRCSKKFFTKVHYEGHLRWHEGKKPYACQQCSTEYSRLHRLKQHILQNHIGTEVPFHCAIGGCDKFYQDQQSLRLHMNTHFSSQPMRNRKKTTVVCELCGKTLSKVTLREHKMMHAGILPYACDQCPRKFRFPNKLAEHKLVHLPIKKYTCSVCGTKKTNKRQLNAHMNIHTREKEYPCQFCKSSFLAKDYLVQHVRVVHDGIKTFRCTFCDQSFGKSGTLKRHIMRHTGEKPHQCPYCDRRFIQKSAMKIHARRHESQVIKTELLVENS